MAEERVSTPVSSDDQIRVCSSPPCDTRNWIRDSTWKEGYLVESVKRPSPTSTPNDESRVKESGSSAESPLDFSMKKRKSINDIGTRLSKSPLRDDDILAQADISSPTYGLMKAFLERRASSPTRRLSSDIESVPTNFLSNRRASSNLLYGPNGAFPLSLAAAAAVVNANSQQESQNLGASNAQNRRHYLTQQLLRGQDQNQNQSLDEYGKNNNDVQSCHNERQIPTFGSSTPTTPQAFLPTAIASPQHGNNQAANRNGQNKLQRPFKAYNPCDPMSALQVGAALGPSALPFLNSALAPSTVGATTTSHLLLPNALTSPTPTSPSSNTLPPILNAQLLSQYRQYLINAQAAAAVAALRAKSNQHLQQQLHQSMQQPQIRQQSNEAIAISIGSNASQSPPQVTSTSHPHTAESSSSASSTASPPSPNHLASAANPASVAAVIMASSTNRIRNSNTQQTKPSRISSGSGSGGSSFNGADEDDEELLHEDDDGVSTNRTSPTPSCASSTAQRSILGNADGAGICASNGNSKNGASIKSENGSNGASSRRKGRSLPDSLKDEAYWERRRKNNEAAKRSRDARRAKEDEIAIRAALLEQENMRLRIEVAALKAETDKLRQMLLNS